MAHEYIEKENQVWRIKGTRVALDSIIYQFRQGARRKPFRTVSRFYRSARSTARLPFIWTIRLHWTSISQIMKPPKRNSVERSPAFFRRAPRSKSDSKKVRCSLPTKQRRSGEMFIIGAGVHFVFSSELREMPGISRNSEERKGKSLLIYKHSVPTALFPSFLNLPDSLL